MAVNSKHPVVCAICLSSIFPRLSVCRLVIAGLASLVVASLLDQVYPHSLGVHLGLPLQQALTQHTASASHIDALAAASKNKAVNNSCVVIGAHKVAVHSPTVH